MTRRKLIKCTNVALAANVDAVWLVKPPTTATYNELNLIGFINYDRLLALVFAGGINN